jgi:hypothetical protein
MTVVEVEVDTDGGFKFTGAAMDVAARLFFSEACAPAFHQVEPRGAGRREVQMETRMTQQPTLDGRGFVGGVVVDDQVEREAGRGLVVNRLQELAELHRPMAAMKLPDHSARLEVERGEQVGGAVAQRVGRAPLSLAGTHRQQRLTAIERLALALLVDTQHQRAVGRIEVEPDDIAHLLDEQRVFGKLEPLDSMRLQGNGSPDAASAHHALTQAAALGHRAGAPVCSVGRRTLQGHPHYSLNLRVADVARGAWPRLIEQARPPPLQEQLGPFADRLVAHSKLVRDRGIGTAAGACQDNPRTLGHACAVLGRRAQHSSVSRSSTARLKAAIGLPVRISLLHPIRRTLADYNLFNTFTTQDTSLELPLLLTLVYCI